MNRMQSALMYTAGILCMMLIGLVGCAPSPDKARQELARLHKQFSTDEFVKSAGDGDTFAVRLFLQAGIDVNSESRDKSTAVGSALVGNKPDVLRLLLKSGAKTSGWYAGGKNLLMLASHSGKLETVKILVEEAGMDVNSRNEATGATPLFYSVLGGNPEVVDYLAKRGARPDVETVFGTPLRGAVDALNKNVVAALLRNGANPFADGNSAILKAEDKFREPFSSSTAHEILAMVQEAARQYTNRTASSPAPVSAKSGDVVQASTLFNDFRNDEERARTKHLGKSLKVSGKIGRKSDDLSDTVYVVLDTGTKDVLEGGVMCVFPESQRQKIYNITAGTDVRIAGTVVSGGRIGTIVVRNCSFE